MRSNVELVTARIERIDQAGIVSGDDKRRDVDVIVCATGFDVKHALSSINIVGMDGSSLDQTWGSEPKAYRGVTVAISLTFFTSGPKHGARAYLAILFIEAQVNYALQCIREITRRRKDFLDVKPGAMGRYNEELQQVLETSVWAAGCRTV